MADTDYSTWPIHGSTIKPCDEDWMKPAGHFNQGFSFTDQLRGGKQTANQNIGAPAFCLDDYLPDVIVEAVAEWATYLQRQTWRLRRRALARFAETFADQFAAINPSLSDEEYESLADIGYTCLLEKLDNGQSITDLDQAHCYTRSVHDEHRFAAALFIETNVPTATIH